MSRAVTVVTPSRLHFGMLSFGRTDVRQFGGVGAMIEQPGLRLRFTAAKDLEAVGTLSDRVMSTALRVAESGLLPARPQCRIEVESAPREHIGLGVGTQLAMGIAAGLNAWCGGPSRSTVELAQAAGRGLRSAIGSYGFTSGGLLIDPGKRRDEMAPAPWRIPLPADWRFVLICPMEGAGISGDAERWAFENLPAVPIDTTDRLCREALLHLAPAAAAADFAEFSEALYHYGHAAGMCFASRQGGPFASGESAQLVSRLRSSGVRGVAQSSWGPLICAICLNDAEAQALALRVTSDSPIQPIQVIVAAANNTGASISIEPD